MTITLSQLKQGAVSEQPLPIGYGGTGAVSNTGARTNFGATTLGTNLFTITNPSAITFLRVNADNTVSTLDASAFRASIGTGTLTSVGGTGAVSGLTLTGTVTTTGNLTLGGTLAVTPSNFASQTANTVLIAPNGAAGVPTFRALVAADIPTLNQNTTGNSANVTGTVAVANGGTGVATLTGIAKGNGTGAFSAAVANTDFLSVANPAFTGTLTGSALSTTGKTIVSKTTAVTVGTAGPSDQWELASAGTGGCIMTFHRNGAYAINMGLDTDNIFRFGGYSQGANTYRFSSDTVGNFVASGNITAYSDERVKKDWVSPSSSLIEDIAKVKSGSFTRTDFDGFRQVGVSAQSLQRVMSEAVLTDSVGKLSVAYGNAAMVVAIELAKRVVDLETRLSRLESK